MLDVTYIVGILILHSTCHGFHEHIAFITLYFGRKYQIYFAPELASSNASPVSLTQWSACRLWPKVFCLSMLHQASQSNGLGQNQPYQWALATREPMRSCYSLEPLLHVMTSAASICPA